MFQEYQKKNNNIVFNYQPIGSGDGVKQLSKGLVDFGASDVQLNAGEKKLFTTKVLEIPLTTGGVVLAYKLSGIQNLKISRTSLEQIFTGKILKWDHDLLKKDNPGVNLPSPPIKVAVRADASGTTVVFTEYLAMISPDFKKLVGSGKAVRWQMMAAKGKGNDGVTALVKNIEGSIGYIEMAYAINQKSSMASLENKQGKFISPSLADFTKSAESAKVGSYQIRDSSISEAYPISCFSFILLPKKGKSEAMKSEVKNF